MNHQPRLVAASVLAVAVFLFVLPLAAQVPQTSAGGQAASAGDDATPELTLEEVEAELAAIEKDSGIADGVKELLRTKYKQAISALKAATDSAARAAKYGEAMKTSADQAAEFHRQWKELPSAESSAKVTAEGSIEELQKDVDSRRAALNGLGDELSNVTSELARVKGRPVEISARLPAVQRELSDLRKQLSSPEFEADATSPGRVADRVLLQANQSRLLSELETLKQEQLSQSVREQLLQANQELLTRQVENGTAALNALGTLLQQRLTSEADRVSSLARALPTELLAGDEATQALVAEVQTLAKQFEEVVELRKQATAAQNDITARIDGLNKEYESIRSQLNLGSGGGAMVRVLFDLQRRVLDALAEERAVVLPNLGQTLLASNQVDERLRGQSDVEKQFRDRSSEAVTRLIATRREVLEKSQSQYGSLTRALTTLEMDRRQSLDKALVISDYVNEQLFWMRSSPPISGKSFTAIPASLRWAFRGDHWVELWRGVSGAATRMPVRCAGLLLVVTVLLLMRGRLIAAIERTGKSVRRTSTDRFAHTGEALLWTILLAVPLPLLIGFAGWALRQFPNPSSWSRDLAYALWIAAWVSMLMAYLSAALRPGGLATAHFGMRKETVAQLRPALHRFAVVYIPAIVMTISYNLRGEAANYFESAGRIIFMLAHAWTAVVLWRLCYSPDSFVATLHREHPNQRITRWRYLWVPLLLACPCALVILAGLGYLITAVKLSLGLLATVALIVGGNLLYRLALRWFMIKQRKLALQEAIKRRRARQTAEASDEEQEVSGEVICVDPDEEQELDWDSVSEQTRALLQLLFGLGVMIAIIIFWSETIPLLTALDSVPVPLTERLTLLGLAKAILLVTVTVVAVRNLPGLLELAVFRTTSIEPGTRNAIFTLCQYAVTAIGLTLILNVLQVEWAKFGWIAAALSVGLGFGLQEVVANFVCGIILLFERPIRVGDVVTLDGITGTVTMIHMRATRITNWDRQDFVVPNKNLITGTILNWTLSAPLNRIVIPVGVAYGSDTEKARQIMLDVAANHPRILDDPAPIASFEQFADSSLNLVLRAYLPDLDNRLGTITELLTEIDLRFAAAGIEIAFPQRDLHLRSGWDGTRSADVEDRLHEAASG